VRMAVRIGLGWGHRGRLEGAGGHAHVRHGRPNSSTDYSVIRPEAFS
jgi:hypothetical protein